MVVTSANIPIVSEYTVSDSGSFTTTIFNALFTDAKEILDDDDPGLSSTQYDRAHALMICHLYQMRNPDSGLSSIRSGSDFSASQTPGESVYSLQYRDIINDATSANIPQEQADIRRCDVDVGDMALDMNAPMEFFTP